MGATVGTAVGTGVGAAVGVWVGTVVGVEVGCAVGPYVGCRVGSAVGDGVGEAEGVPMHLEADCRPMVHVPGSHVWHTWYPVLSWYLPLGQWKQFVAPIQAL